MELQTQQKQQKHQVAEAAEAAGSRSSTSTRPQRQQQQGSSSRGSRAEPSDWAPVRSMYSIAGAGGLRQLGRHQQNRSELKDCLLLPASVASAASNVVSAAHKRGRAYQERFRPVQYVKIVCTAMTTQHVAPEACMGNPFTLSVFVRVVAAMLPASGLVGKVQDPYARLMQE